MKYGYKKDKPDARDLSFNLIKPKLSFLGANNTNDEHIVLGNDQVEVFDQLTLNSCVANSTIGALQILLAQNNKLVNLSRLFCYWVARSKSRSTGTDDGTFIRDAYSTLQSLGVCLESTWKYIPLFVFTQPTLESFKEGNDNIVTNFYRIDSADSQRADDIIIALKANHPVSFGVEVSFEFERYQGENRLWLPPNNIPVAGAHAMLIIGYRINSDGTRNFKVKNSWNSSWGISGYCWMSESYVNEFDDLWVPTLMPDLLF